MSATDEKRMHNRMEAQIRRLKKAAAKLLAEVSQIKVETAALLSENDELKRRDESERRLNEELKQKAIALGVDWRVATKMSDQ